MKITKLETLFCDAGWRTWIFLKISTDSGLVGWSEMTDSHGSPRGLKGIIEDLSPLVVGREPNAEAVYWDLYKATRQTPGGLIAKALGGIENALLDLKGKELGVPVYELFGGPTRNTVPVYWSHCGTTRARAWEVCGLEKLSSYDRVWELAFEVSNRGFSALKTNIVIPGKDPIVWMPGFGKAKDIDVSDALKTLMGALSSGDARIILDLNFNLSPSEVVRIARELEPYNLLWLEMDCYDPKALAEIRGRIRQPVCSGENLYGSRAFRPYFEARSMDIASVDVIWNGFGQAKKIADMAETFEVNVAPHNYYSHLATFISAQLCAAVPNVQMLEVDVDDVPWKDEITSVPDIVSGSLKIPAGPGWGCDVNEELFKRGADTP